MSAAVDISGDGGILYDCKIGGNGTKPQEGMIVFAHYTGKLQNGQVFDSSKDKPHRRDGFYFQLGAGQVIKGWDLGFSSMCIGEVGELTLRSDYAYGEHGSPPLIPPRATLVFEVELLDARFMTNEELDAQDRKVAALRQ